MSSLFDSRADFPTQQLEVPQHEPATKIDPRPRVDQQLFIIIIIVDAIKSEIVVVYLVVPLHTQWRQCCRFI